MNSTKELWLLTRAKQDEGFWRCNLKWREKKRREKKRCLTSTNNVCSYCQKHHSAFRSENLTWKVHDKARSLETQQNQRTAAMKPTHKQSRTHSRVYWGNAFLFIFIAYFYVQPHTHAAWSGPTLNLRGKAITLTTIICKLSVFSVKLKQCNVWSNYSSGPGCTTKFALVKAKPPLIDLKCTSPLPTCTCGTFGGLAFI